MQAGLSRENCSIKAPRADKGAAQMQGFPSAMIKKPKNVQNKELFAQKMCRSRIYSL
jgi:hypothetical protein